MLTLTATDVTASCFWAGIYGYDQVWALDVSPSDRLLMLGAKVPMPTSCMGVIVDVAAWTDYGYFPQARTSFLSGTMPGTRRYRTMLVMPIITIWSGASSGGPTWTNHDVGGAYNEEGFRWWVFAVPPGVDFSSFSPVPTHMRLDGVLYSETEIGSIHRLPSAMDAPIGPCPRIAGVISDQEKQEQAITAKTGKSMLAPAWARHLRIAQYPYTAPRNYTIGYGITAGGMHVVNYPKTDYPYFASLSDLNDGKIYSACDKAGQLWTQDQRLPYKTFTQDDCTLLYETGLTWAASAFDPGYGNPWSWTSPTYISPSGEEYLMPLTPHFPLYDYPSFDGDVLRGGFVLQEL